MKKILSLLIPAVFAICCKREGSGDVKPTLPAPTTGSLAAANTITFSGYNWIVRNTTGTQGPGPNYWSGSNVFVDSSGYLHLKITRVGGKWYCAEVTSTRNFGYGTYQWFIDGRIDALDKNEVLGLFNYSGDDGFDEMDIEYARWGIPTADNTNFTVYPAQGSSLANWHTTCNTSLKGSRYTTQRFKRTTASSVFFQELKGFQTGNASQIASATCSNPPNSISRLAMPVHMNFWLFQGHAPTNTNQLEIVVRSFSFKPL